MSEKSRRDRKGRERRVFLLGVGLDGNDGHKRMTKGENFYLIGGSEKTHELMQEKAIKLNEHLTKRGKRLEDISKEDLYKIIEDI